MMENEQKAADRAAYEQERRDALRTNWRESGRLEHDGRRFQKVYVLPK